MNIVERIGQELKRICPEIPVYREQQREGFIEPSFFVEPVNSTLNPELFNYQNRNYGFQVVYFPNPNKPAVDMETIKDILMNNFNTLSDWATLRNRSFNTVDNTLVVNFDVIIRAYPDVKEQKQQEMKYYGGVKSE